LLLSSQIRVRQQFFENNSQESIQSMFDGVYGNTEGSHQDKVKAAVAAVVGNEDVTGLVFLQSTDDKKQSFEQIK
jgi:hypothetical protein